MTPERFQQIEELYHAARTRTGEERAAMLAGADPELRREVESLLAQPGSARFLDRPAAQNATELLDTVTVVTNGASLGPYRIEGKLGQGGMGEVFRAVDTRLGRAVAVKTAHERFSDRFQREARAIASLNHPNICTLHDVGPNYLVMELVEGETIAARLKSGPLPLKTALLYASQIAAALVEAHGKGIIHRDLKPGNIMIARSGIKVLDFGLAKSGADETLTASHMVMGTPAYMAPEQREGKPADARTDIYSFGCVFYEMLTGGRVGARRKRIPLRGLEKVVNRCLEEDPGLRWQSAEELERELGKVAASKIPWQAATAAAAILAIFAAAYAYLHRAPKLTDKDTIVLADFENKTGDPVFDQTIRQGLAVQLQQSPFLRLISDQKMRSTLKLMGQDQTAPLTPEVAREICERLGAKAMLTGSIASLGSRYVLGLKTTNCATGDAMYDQQAQSAGKEQVLNTLGEMAATFRTHAGESLSAIREHNVPLREAATSSLEALKAYSYALAHTGSGESDWIPFLKRAVELDPTFAAAWADLGIAYAAEPALSKQYSIKAFDLRDNASGPEKFNIDYTYHRNVTGNLEKAWEVVSLWTQTYPRDAAAFGLSGGYAANGTGRFDQAVEADLKAVALDPDLAPPWGNLVRTPFYQGRFGEVEKGLPLAVKHNAASPELMLFRYRLASLQQDRQGMEQVVSESRGKPQWETVFANSQGLMAANEGRLDEADRHARQAVDLARTAGETERAAVFHAASAVWNAFFGNRAEARVRADGALKIFEGRDVDYAAGFALGLAEDTVRAEALAERLNKEYPEDTQVQASYVPALRALAAIHRNDPQKALDALEANRRYELGIPPIAFNNNYGNMYPVYVRGLAYLAMKRGEDAAGEFERILVHPGHVTGDPVESAARLQLARSFALAGYKERAKNTYESFLAKWKDADQNLTLLKEVRAEAARLDSR